MGATRNSYDVVVIGGGPVGSVAAIAFARKGARVLVLEADPRASRRFAGEWIHPAGVAVLDELRAGRLDGASPRTGYGFVIVPNDGDAPIEMPYPDGVALACAHESIVESLRNAAAATRGVELVQYARVVSIDGHKVIAEEKKEGRRVEITAGRVIGADGRSSTARRALGFGENSALVSYMASVELRDVELPSEGFGHVILGGPGPALLYRISEGVVRGCLDVPLGSPRTPAYLWNTFGPVLPEPLRPALRRALEERPLQWAAIRFRPRADFGRDPISLVGDALGHVHPMTAIGITMGLLDVQSAAAHSTVDAYARARGGYVPELLSNALYHCFRRGDASATAVREAMFRLLRASRYERQRTMGILSCREEGAASFGGAFLRVAAGAIGSTAARATRDGGLRALPGALSAFGEWMQWPLAGVMPAPLRETYRAQSTSTHPIPLLRDVVQTNEAPRAVLAFSSEERAPAAPKLEKARPAPQPARSPEAMAKATELLMRELEALAMQLGRVSDEVLAGPGMRMMRAITATEMRTGIAARMTIGRRWLVRDGVPRLLALSAASPSGFATAHLADLLLVLLGGPTGVRSAIARLDDGVDALLACQTANGGFALRARNAAHSPADLRSTAAACHALAVVRQRRPGAHDARIVAALDRAARWLRAEQSADGAWSAADAGRIDATAWALEALAAAGASASDSAITRAAAWLLARQADDGAFVDDSASSDPARDRTTARALRALLAAGAAEGNAIDAAAARISIAMVAEPAESPARGEIPPWEVCCDILEALALHEARKKASKQEPAMPSESPHPAPAAIADADWAFCRQSLVEVSRSFSRPIALLPRDLEIAVTLGYLLCRAADTIEDHLAVPKALREPLFNRFLEVLHGGGDAAAIAASFAQIPGEDAELNLARNLPLVMRVFRAQPASTQKSSVRWVAEMVRGMSLYSHREPGADGVVALHTPNDLERYCYYVAGTVGHLLTDLFLEALGDEATPERALTLRSTAESFGAGLQLVNILKDVTDDQERRWSYIPRTSCAARGIEIGELTDPRRRAAAHAVVAPLFDIARRYLDEGLTYALTIPPRFTGIRLFCLLPLWMAARTLVLAKGNDAMFIPGAAVKISREEVESIIGACMTHHADDAALRAHYASLWDAPPSAQRLSAG